MQAEMCCVIVCASDREKPPSVPGCALEIPLHIGVSDLLLHSAVPYIGRFNYGTFHTLKYRIESVKCGANTCIIASLILAGIKKII